MKDRYLLYLFFCTCFLLFIHKTSNVNYYITKTKLDFRFGPPPSSNFSFCIASHGRHEKLQKSIESIRKLYKEEPIIVVDDGRQYWDNVTYGVEYIKIPYDMGLPMARNVLVENVETPYMFLMDEDVNVEEHSSSLYDMIFVLENTDFAMVSGKLSGTWLYYANIKVVGGKYHVCEKVDPALWMNPERGIRCKISNRCLNLFMTRTKFLKDNPWDTDRKICEHSLYFGKLQETHPGLQVASCSNFKFFHNNRGNPKDYKKDRKRCGNKDSDKIVEVC